MRKIAIITGASRGIGAATAGLAAAAGYDVCVNFTRDAEAADRTVADCNKAGVRAFAAKADVSEPDDVRRLFAQCDAQLGKVTLLVNNAGIVGNSSKLVDLRDNDLHRTFAINVFGTIYCCREAINRMARSRGGSGGAIVNLSSVAASLGSPNEYIHYASSKAAVETLTIGLAKEVGPEGIRVNAIQAGTIDTEIHATSGNPERPGAFAKIAPLGRVGEVGDIAETIMWLASDKAAFTTGAVVRVAGGV